MLVMYTILGIIFIIGVVFVLCVYIAYRYGSPKERDKK